jgi:hypothetical protein
LSAFVGRGLDRVAQSSLSARRFSLNPKMASQST